MERLRRLFAYLPIDRFANTHLTFVIRHLSFSTADCQRFPQSLIPNLHLLFLWNFHLNCILLVNALTKPPDGFMMQHTSPLETLKNVFGFDEFRSGQKEVIDLLLAGKSALAVFPTGSGKSLCYQLPALHLSGLTLVISPLIALMKDQVEFLKSRNIAAERLDSTLEWEEARRIYSDLREGRLKILFIAPERLSNERFRDLISGLSIDLMVVDEAHCISEWGHNFRPEYLKLARLAEQFKVGRILAVTATATPRVAEDICRGFNIEDDAYINTGFYRPNLTLYFSICSDPAERSALLLSKLKERPPGPTIVYVTLQRTAEDVAAELAGEGFNARPYHAGMHKEDRTSVQDWFMASDSAIVVATIAFGMGIDKSDIRYVYHYNLPKTLENYSQEIGRAGRDGEPSICEVIAYSPDIIVLENFVYGDTPEPQAIEQLIGGILSKDNEFDVSIYELSAQHDIRNLVVKTLLTYLELMGILESTSPFFADYKFQFIAQTEELLGRFDDIRRDFLERLFAIAKKGRTWLTLNANNAAVELGEKRERVISALNYLEEQGLIRLQVSGARQGYRFLKRSEDVAALCEELTARFVDSEAANIARIDGMMALIRSDACCVRKLLAYFGEDLQRDCGHCQWCDGRGGLNFARPEASSIDIDGRLIREIVSQTPLTRTRQVTRFLCGLPSPAISRNRLRGHEAYGLYEDVPFAHVLQAVRGYGEE